MSWLGKDRKAHSRHCGFEKIKFSAKKRQSLMDLGVFICSHLRCGNNPLVLLEEKDERSCNKFGRALRKSQKRKPPLCKGRGLRSKTEGLYNTKTIPQSAAKHSCRGGNSLGQSPTRPSREPPLHKGAFEKFCISSTSLKKSMTCIKGRLLSAVYLPVANVISSGAR